MYPLTGSYTHNKSNNHRHLYPLYSYFHTRIGKIIIYLFLFLLDIPRSRVFLESTQLVDALLSPAIRLALPSPTLQTPPQIYPSLQPLYPTLCHTGASQPPPTYPCQVRPLNSQATAIPNCLAAGRTPWTWYPALAASSCRRQPTPPSNGATWSRLQAGRTTARRL